LANAANLVNFGSGGTLAVGDWTYSAYPLTAPTYLPLNNDTASYLTSSYPTLGAIYAPTTVAYSAAATTMPFAASNITYGNGVFMTTLGTYASSGYIATSPDGVTWAPNGISYTGLGKVAYGKGKFAILGYSGTTFGVTVTNDNGATFTFSNAFKLTEIDFYSVASTIDWTDIVYTGNLFVAMGYFIYRFDALSPDRYQIRFVFNVSPDGVNYTYTYVTGITVTVYGTVPQAKSGAYGGGNLVYSIWTPYDVTYAQGFSSTVYSTDLGATWAAATTPPPNNSAYIIDTTYGAGLFVALNYATSAATPAATNVYYTSPTGAVWTARTMPASLFWKSITYANGYFIAVGVTAGATTTVYSSPDGLTWTARTVPTATGVTSRGRIAGGGGKFVFMDNNVGATRIGSGVLINLNTASANFSLPYIRPIAGTQAFIKAS
jgi:hypothetical protein